MTGFGRAETKRGRGAGDILVPGCFSSMSVRFLPCGDTAFSVQFGDVIDRSLNESVVRTKTAIDESGLTGVVETVPSYRALLIYYDPLQTTQAELIKQMAESGKTFYE